MGNGAGFGLSCDTGKANVRWLSNEIFGDGSANASTKAFGYNLTNEYDIYVDGRLYGSPSKSPWKVKASEPHTLQAKNGPYFEVYTALLTTPDSDIKEIATCYGTYPDWATSFFDVDDIEEIKTIYDNGFTGEVSVCPAASNFSTVGTFRVALDDLIQDSLLPPGENTTCTVFTVGEESDVFLDLTVVLNSQEVDDVLEDDFLYNYSFAYGRIPLVSVLKCKSVGSKCKSSEKCCLGYACIRKNADDKKGNCGQCVVSGGECFSTDECCDGLKCSNKGKCKTA